MRGGQGGVGAACIPGSIMMTGKCAGTLVCNTTTKRCEAATVKGKVGIGGKCVVGSKVATTKCAGTATCNPSTLKCVAAGAGVGTAALGKPCKVGSITPATMCVPNTSCNPTTLKCVAGVVGKAVIGAPCQVGSTVAATKCAGTATCSGTTKKCIDPGAGIAGKVAIGKTCVVGSTVAATKCAGTATCSATTKKCVAAAAAPAAAGTVTAIKMQITLANLKANRNAIEAAAGLKIVGVANSSGVKQQLGGALPISLMTPTLIVAFNGTINPTRLKTAVAGNAALKKVLVVDTVVTPVPLSLKPVTAATGGPATTPTTTPTTQQRPAVNPVSRNGNAHGFSLFTAGMGINQIVGDDKIGIDFPPVLTWDIDGFMGPNGPRTYTYYMDEEGNGYCIIAEDEPGVIRLITSISGSKTKSPLTTAGAKPVVNFIAHDLRNISNTVKGLASSVSNPDSSVSDVIVPLYTSLKTVLADIKVSISAANAASNNLPSAQVAGRRNKTTNNRVARMRSRRSQKK